MSVCVYVCVPGIQRGPSPWLPIVTEPRAVLVTVPVVASSDVPEHVLKWQRWRRGSYVDDVLVGSYLLTVLTYGETVVEKCEATYTRRGSSLESRRNRAVLRAISPAVAKLLLSDWP